MSSASIRRIACLSVTALCLAGCGGHTIHRAFHNLHGKEFVIGEKMEHMTPNPIGLHLVHTWEIRCTNAREFFGTARELRRSMENRGGMIYPMNFV